MYEYDHNNCKEELRGMGCFKNPFVDIESQKNELENITYQHELKI